MKFLENVNFRKYKIYKIQNVENAKKQTSHQPIINYTNTILYYYTTDNFYNTYIKAQKKPTYYLLAHWTQNESIKQKHE